MKREADSRTPRILCVGAGRDGTLSVSRMIQNVFDRTDRRRARHEYRAREFYQAFCEYAETGNDAFAGEIRQLIDQCPFDCIVGNGYAAILPFFREQWGPETRLVHIRRTNRDACIASLMKNCEMFPAAYRYYSADKEAVMKRMTAFHFGEMTKANWDRLSIAEKLGWYYDKTHELIDLHRGLFAECIEVTTEALDSEQCRRAIARMLTGSEAVVPPPIHLHAHSFDIGSFAPAQRDRAMWLVGQIDWNNLVDDDLYAIEYFLEKFARSTDAQIRGAPLVNAAQKSGAETAELLARARATLEAALKNIDIFEKRNHEVESLPAQNSAGKR